MSSRIRAGTKTADLEGAAAYTDVKINLRMNKYLHRKPSSFARRHRPAVGCQAYYRSLILTKMCKRPENM